MSQANCPREAELLKAVRTGMWEEGLSAHVLKCADCREIAQASQWMQTLAQNSEKPTLSDASLLWWRAHLSEKQAKAERAQELLEWTEIISAIIIFAGLAGWVGWNWYAIQTQLTLFLTDTWSQLWITASSALNTTPITLSLGAVILSFVAVVVAYPLLVRD